MGLRLINLGGVARRKRKDFSMTKAELTAKFGLCLYMYYCMYPLRKTASILNPQQPSTVDSSSYTWTSTCRLQPASSNFSRCYFADQIFLTTSNFLYHLSLAPPPQVIVHRLPRPSSATFEVYPRPASRNSATLALSILSRKESSKDGSRRRRRRR